MKSQVSLTIALIAIILVSCAPISTPEPIESTSTNAPQPTATFTLEPTATFTPEPTVTFTPEPTATFTPEPTNTPELFDVQVLAFWDYNGNGVLDETEPLLEGVVSKIGNAECVTNGEGNCLIDLPKGRYTTKFSTETAIDPNGVVITNLNYLFVGTDVLSLSRGYSIYVDTHMQIMAALGQGQIAVPVSRSSVTEIPLDFLDIGPYGKHYAIDYMIGGNGPQKIYASISGKIDDYPFGDCNVVSIIVRGPNGNFNVGMGHLTSVYVTPGQTIIKGQEIGEIDPTLYRNGNKVACTNQPHLEFYIYGPGGVGTNSDWGWLNPYDFFTKKIEPHSPLDQHPFMYE